MLVNFHRECIGDAKKSPVGPRHNMQARYWNWFFDSWRLDLKTNILALWCGEYVMIHYNNDNNAYCRAVNAQKFETIEHNTVLISTLLYTRNPYSYSHFEIFICICSIRGEIDQISINRPTCRYITCCAANVYIFVYILIGTLIAPIRWEYHGNVLSWLNHGGLKFDLFVSNLGVLLLKSKS